MKNIREHYCLNCNGCMVEVERLKDGRTTSGGTYRKRRFECEDCGCSELIHSNGSRDLNR